MMSTILKFGRAQAFLAIFLIEIPSCFENWALNFIDANGKQYKPQRA